MQERKITLIDIGAGALPSVTPVTAQNSSWFPTVYVSPETPPVDGVTPEPVADGVLIEWDAIDQAGVVYIIERGPSQNGPWTEIHRTTETRYLYSDGSGQKWYFRITASVRGKPGQGTVVEATPVPTTAQLVTAQQKLDKEIVDRALADANEAAARARDIGSVNASLVLEAQTRVTQIGQAMDAIAAEGQTRATDLLNEKLEREAAITAVSETQQNGFDSLSRALSEVAAGSGTQFDSKRIWDFNLTVENWTGNGAPVLVDGWLRPANAAANPYVQSPGGLAIDGSAYRYVKMRIKKVGKPAWAGALQWITTTDATWNAAKRVAMAEPAWDSNGVATMDAADVPWWPATVAAIRLQLGAAQALSDYYLIDWVAIGRPSPGASVALVQEETQARVTALAAEATQRNTLAVQMRGNYAGTDLSQAQGFMGDERTARAAADSAQVQRITTMEARMPAGSGGLATSASVTTLQDAMVAADQANAQATTKVSSDLRAAMGRGVNLVINGDIGNDLAGWQITGGQPGTWSVSATEGRGGGKCLKGTSVPFGVVTSAQANLNEGIEVKVGRRYRLRAWVKVSADYVGDTDNSKIRVGAVRTDGTEVLLWSRVYNSGWTNWTVVENVFTIAEGTTRFRLSAGLRNTAGYVLVDDFEFVDITDEELIASNASGLTAITTRVGVVEGTLVSQGTALTQVQADVAGKASNAALTSLDSKVTQLANTVTSQGTALTSVTASLQNIGGDNLVGNSSFEREATSAGGVPGWGNNSAGLGSAVTRRLLATSMLPGSSRAWRWELQNVPVTGYLEAISNTVVKSTRIVPGEKVTVSAYLRGTPGTRWFLQIAWHDANGAVISYIGSPGTTTLTDENWSRKVFTPANPAPANAAAARVYLRAYGLNVVDQWVEWDNVQLQVGAVATGYTPSLDEIASATEANSIATSTLSGKVTALEGTTTAQGQAITTASAKLTALMSGGVSVFPQGTFETFDTDAQLSNSNGVSFTVRSGNSSGIRRTGGKAMEAKVVTTSSSGNADVNISGDVPVSPARSYYVEGFARLADASTTPTSGSAHLGVRAADEADGNLHWPVVGQNLSGLTNAAWTKISGYITTSGSAARIRLFASLRGARQAGVIVMFDDLTISDVTDALGAKATAEAAANGLSALTTTVTQQGGQITALGQQVNQVGASVAGKADASVVQTLTATVNSNLTGSGNQIPNSTFATDTLGWTLEYALGWSGTGGFGWGRDQSGRYLDQHGIHVVGIRSDAVSGATINDNACYIYTDKYLPVVPGSTVILSGYISTFGYGRGGVVMKFSNGAGDFIAEPISNLVSTPDSNWGHISQWTRVFLKYTVPAGATKAKVGMFARCDVSAGRFAGVWMAMPMLEVAKAESTGPSPYSAGGNESFAGYSMYVTADGLTGGLVTKNDGKVVDMKILANVLQILSPNKPEGIEMRDGYIRVWKGNSQRIIGTGFGSGDLMDYFGPNVGAGAANKQNATVWMDVNGNAYFGGTLSAGIWKNANRTDSTAPYPYVEVGPFPAHGRQRLVVASFSTSSPTYTTWYDGRSWNNEPPPPSISTTTVLRLRRNAGGGLQLVSQQAFQAYSVLEANIYHDRDAGIPQLPNGGWQQMYFFACDGSFTATEPGSTFQNFVYEAAITAQGIGQIGRQSMSVVSTEEP
ncbi:carbohydrate binding domain-containing protein [Stenotrophomonas sp. NPDC078853]|uniref:carbohydrate binding domain-containing protein n=1 Tax=Stenotrophomonas sp. NPDC078853 TaxID=3364534 RepID=UPI00384E06E8